jgi:hypothetical protein
MARGWGGHQRFQAAAHNHGRGHGNPARFANFSHDRHGWADYAGHGKWRGGDRAFGRGFRGNGFHGDQGFRQAFAGFGHGPGFHRGNFQLRYDRGFDRVRDGSFGYYGGGRQWLRFRDARDFSGDYRPAWSPLIEGCPPFAWYDNCLSPAAARPIWGYADPYDDWYTYPTWYRYGSGYRWRYYGGYLYRVDPATALIGAFLPLLGGALYDGNVWPAYYDDYAVDPYYVRYYGYQPARYDYRYGDGAIFAVDHHSHRIHTVVALLTGDRWVVGERMPDGFDFYNIPPAYRDSYYDRPDAWYRYCDGYVYEIDPATLVVRQSIELLVTT